MNIYVKVIESRVIYLTIEADSLIDAQRIHSDGDFPDLVENCEKVKDIQVGEYSPKSTYSTKPFITGGEE